MDGSVSNWLVAFKAGDQAMAERLWSRYYSSLVRIARSRIRTVSNADADEDDIVLKAFDSFCRGADAGRFPRLTDRDDLWRLLVVITVRKAIDHVKRQQRRGRWLPMARMSSNGGSDRMDDVADAVCDQPSPEFCAEAADNVRTLLGMLDDDLSRNIAVWKMEGYNNIEIAAKMNCSLRTIERKLRLIRHEWSYYANL
jgi:DNA-directed RNA polymerase specialized sigma24 family protein